MCSSDLMGWTPDSRSVVFWAGGKIRRAGLDGHVADIPFRVQDTRTVIDPPRPQVAVAPERFTTRMARYASVSPDGRQAVWESVGKLWTKTLPDGKPRRLTQTAGSELELFPSVSRDGKRIVFVSWTDAGLGQLKIVPASGGNARTITTDPGHYRRPRFSPDGKTIVFEKGKGGRLLSDAWSQQTGIFRISADGGTVTRISTDEIGRAHV